MPSPQAAPPEQQCLPAAFCGHSGPILLSAKQSSSLHSSCLLLASASGATVPSRLNWARCSHDPQHIVAESRPKSREKILWQLRFLPSDARS